MNIFISMLILVLLFAIGMCVVYWLWVYKRWGVVVLIGFFMCGAIEAHSIIYPKNNLKESYARLIE
jgi:asparagine N-glycosylation enzyme membrane subunit Stt3